jgi:oxygen-independent coproporphyrinogen-3 oxidase
MVSPRYTVPSPVEPALELVRKYNIPGPRYTSYPTAPQFTAEVDRPALLTEIQRDNADSSRPLSLYFHLPFCESLCWYCGCNTVITKRLSSATEYVDLLCRELELTKPLINTARPVTQLHFGGGTPTFLPPAEIDRLGRAIHSVFTFAPDAEISVEIDPRRLTKEHVEAYRRLGCNRASLGVQDTNPQVQLAIHRWQPLEQTAQAITWLREAGYESVSVDLIYGLPLQTPETFSQTVEAIIALNPDRLAVFSYAHVPWLKPAQKIFDQRQQLPTTEAKLAMLTNATRALTSAGYAHIGMDHFARPNDELAIAHDNGTLYRNFQGYTTRAGASLYGFGMSSISQTDSSFRQNHKDLEEYQTGLMRGELPIERGCLLTSEDRNRRTLIMEIMCRNRVDYATLSQRLGLDVAQTYAAEIQSLKDLAADGLVNMDPTGFSITPMGELFRRIIAMRFDAYLSKPRPGFSKVI